MIRYNLNYAFNAPVDINQKLPAFITAMAESGFYNEISTPSLIVYRNNQNDQIIINPVQFTYQIERMFSFDELTSALVYVQFAAKVFSSEIRGLTIVFADTKPLEGISSLDATRNISIFDISEACFSDVTGIGLRFISGRGENGLYSEFKCEPLLRDTHYLYFESINNFEYHPDINIGAECEKIAKSFGAKRDFLYNKILGKD